MEWKREGIERRFLPILGSVIMAMTVFVTMEASDEISEATDNGVELKFPAARPRRSRRRKPILL